MGALDVFVLAVTLKWGRCNIKIWIVCQETIGTKLGTKLGTELGTEHEHGIASILFVYR